VRQLINTWTTGKVRSIHEGFRVHRIIGKSNRPGDEVGRVYESAETAIETAERLGEGYAAFRVAKVGSSLEPKELIRRSDLPITVNQNLGK
jgi:hypothetical protein